MRSRGFTLVEIMIVVAIVAILGAVALPSYRSSVLKSQRAEARGVLLETAQFMQRFYSQNDRYDQDRAGAAVAIPGPLATVQIPVRVPSGFHCNFYAADNPLYRQAVTPLRAAA